MTTIVTSSSAARPPMPLRVATSPSKSPGEIESVGIAGAERVYLPGSTRTSGSDAPVSTILIS